ncbi:MAG: PHP domain-containing protein [Anaerostipes sp.]|jgi:predicted metal-dependent phosphoesterase TrpH|nr:PHP domain-containing protein [Anaerostipes sp.]MDD5968607.1 PHP domain-containing protein [Anaerostipes sp.]
MKHYIDLHMHSLYSDDGEHTPASLVDMCHEKGIQIMAISDHNQVAAIAEGRKRAKELGMIYISAIEIDCTFHDRNFHVVGYGINEQEPYFTQLNDDIYQQEVKLSEKKMELTRELGFDVTKEDLDQLSDNGVYTGEMFGEVLLGKEEYREHPLLKPYREGGDRSGNPYVNFYWDYYSQGKPCYTKVIYPSLAEAVDQIHRCGGKAVLAHPGANLRGKYEVFDQMMEEVALDGVEAFSNYHDEATVDYFYKKGQEYNIMVTCGSDFHGKTKPSIQLGECHCPYDQEFIEEMLKAQGLI